MSEQETPYPVFPPIPPDQPPVAHMKEMVAKEVEERTKSFKELPTPVDFATLASDVKHLRNYLIAACSVIAVFVGITVTAYFHLDDKISDLQKTINDEVREIDGNFRDLKDKVGEDISGINGRVNNALNDSNDNLEGRNSNN